MPSFGNSSLRKYEDRFFVSGIGRFSFSIRYHDLAALSRMSEAGIESPVRQSATGLMYRIRTNAPHRSGDLRRGLMVAPGREKTAVPGKVVNDIVFDRAMNDTFVKMSRSGKRYYYPASQEYGFRIGRGRRVPGLYYMRDTSAAFYAEHEETVVDSVLDLLEDL